MRSIGTFNVDRVGGSAGRGHIGRCRVVVMDMDMFIDVVVNVDVLVNTGTRVVAMLRDMMVQRAPSAFRYNSAHN